MENKNVILTQEAIEKKIERIAYEIYELNYDEPSIILAGIWDRGSILTAKIAAHLRRIAPFHIDVMEIKLDKQHPLDVELSHQLDFSNKCVGHDRFCGKFRPQIFICYKTLPPFPA